MTYFIWHYTSGFRAGLIVARDLNRFVLNFFSLPLLFKTLFSPWRRLGESYARGLNPEQWLATFTVNLLMRLIGAFIRLTLILIGLVTLLIVAIISVVALLIWLLLPVVFISLLVAGLFLLTA